MGSRAWSSTMGSVPLQEGTPESLLSSSAPPLESRTRTQLSVNRGWGEGAKGGSPQTPTLCSPTPQLSKPPRINVCCLWIHLIICGRHVLKCTHLFILRHHCPGNAGKFQGEDSESPAPRTSPQPRSNRPTTLFSGLSPSGSDDQRDAHSGDGAARREGPHPALGPG